MKSETSPNGDQRFRDYIANPPQGSALRKAIDFGIDPTITFRNMFVLTAEERLANAENVIRSTRQLLGVARGSRKK